MKTWAIKYDKCSSCHSTDYPHHAKGLCTSCYHRQYERKNKPQRHDSLEQFVDALPTILRQVGITGYAASYSQGTVTIKKLGSKLSATWPK